MREGDYQNMKAVVNEGLRLLEKKEVEQKKNFVILIIYPMHPIEEKRRILRLQRKLKVDRKWPNTYLMEDFESLVNCNNKFRLLASEKGLGPDLIAAVFTQEGGKEGESWELGFLWSSAIEKYLVTGQRDLYEKFMRRIVAFVERGIQEKELVTKMLSNGTFKRISVHTFDDDDELLNLVDSTARRLLDYKFDLLDTQ